MKNKKRLSLRARISFYFILCCLLVETLMQLLDGVFSHFMENRLSTGNAEMNEISVFQGLIILILASVALYIVGAFVFYKLTSKALKEESERRVQEQNLIYASIAHDLKTPMTSVQGFAKALMDGKVKPEEQQEIFEIICRKSASMNDMVNTLFDYAKLGTDGCHAGMEQLDLAALVKGIIAENYTDFEERHILLEMDLPEQAVMVMGERTELKRAISNLVVNVYKHNPEGIKACITLRQQQEKAVIRIADSGQPLPKDMDIFQPFVTENTARTAGGGTGLGLAITKRIIQHHGGGIETEVCEDGYTKAFVVTLKTV